MKKRIFLLLACFALFQSEGQNRGEMPFEFNKGDTVPEIALKDSSGQILRLSSLKGNYVILNFWGSWCKYCKKRNEELLKIYKKRSKQKYFEIFSVAFDEDRADWIRIIRKDSVLWKYNVRDAEGKKSKLFIKYGLLGVPYTILLDKEGKVREVDLKEENIEKIIDHLFLEQ